MSDYCVHGYMAVNCRFCAGADQLNMLDVTRFEVITDEGRVFVQMDALIHFSVQDDGRTLKVFVKRREVTHEVPALPVSGGDGPGRPFHYRPGSDDDLGLGAVVRGRRPGPRSSSG